MTWIPKVEKKKINKKISWLQKILEKENLDNLKKVTRIPKVEDKKINKKVIWLQKDTWKVEAI